MAGKRICLVPRLQGVGGMVSFQHKLAAGLVRRGVETCYDLADTPYQAVLVIGGTRQLGGLWRAHRNGTRIVQRLDGMNWLHRKVKTSLRHFLRAEYGNWLLTAIRRRIAQQIVYQSEFSRRWWERVHGSTSQPNVVIYNGVDLQQYSPDGAHQRPDNCYRLLMVEGSLMGGYEAGLAAGIALAEGLNEAGLSQLVELMVAGRVPVELQQTWDQRSKIHIHWAGLVANEAIPALDRSAHLLYSADLNPACPNSVIEALACGLPVASFDTGALPELVTPLSGRVVPYGGDPWKLESPDMPALVQGAAQILADQPAYRAGARQRAEEAFGVDPMVDRYLEVLLES
jgi:glycosyltransferase involved in cell wall biosynthesis